MALPLLGLNYKLDLADMPDCLRWSSDFEETAEHAFYYCVRVRPFWNHVGEWIARIEPKHLVLRIKLRSCGVSCDLSCGQNGDFDDAKEGIV